MVSVRVRVRVRVRAAPSRGFRGEAGAGGVVAVWGQCTGVREGKGIVYG
jgi:hypothetical protein